MGIVTRPKSRLKSRQTVWENARLITLSSTIEIRSWLIRSIQPMLSSRFPFALTLTLVLSLPNSARAETVTASALFQAYEQNEIVAEDSYNGRRIGIDGQVSGLKQAIMGAPIVLLDAGAPDQWISCHFPQKAQAEIAKLQVGDQVNVDCRIKYRMGNTIHASACRLKSVGAGSTGAGPSTRKDTSDERGSAVILASALRLVDDLFDTHP
jgi:hypothetical protein